MQDYQSDLDYELEMMRQSGPAAVAKEAALILDELARGIASSKMPLDMVERKKALFYSLAQELKDSPEALEAFRWARFFHTAATEYEAKSAVDPTSPDNVAYGHRCWDATLTIVRAQCGFIEPYLGVQLSEVEALLKHYGRL